MAVEMEESTEFVSGCRLVIELQLVHASAAKRVAMTVPRMALS